MINDNDPQETDYYEMLHVHPQAPLEIIRASYRTIMQKLKQHPDLGGSDGNAAQLNTAYATLKDPNRRKAYDQQRKRSKITRTTAHSTASKPNKPASPTTARPPRSSTGLIACPFCQATAPSTTLINPPADCKHCGSPTQPPANVANPSTNQRLLERREQSYPLTVYTQWPGQAKVARCQDISPRGMRFTADWQVPAGSIVKLECSVCRAIARVAHCRAEGASWSYGVAFVTLAFTSNTGTFLSTQA